MTNRLCRNKLASPPGGPPSTTGSLLPLGGSVGSGLGGAVGLSTKPQAHHYSITSWQSNKSEIYNLYSIIIR